MTDASRHVPADPALPALRELLGAEPSDLGGVIGSLVPHSVRQSRPAIRYVRYRPGRDCIVAWQLDGTDGTPYLVSARLFHDGRHAHIVARDEFMQQVTTIGNGASVPYGHVPDKGLLLQAFPLDYRLPTLAHATSPDWARHVLASLGRCDSHEPIRVDVLPGSYKPWIRAVLRYRTIGGGHDRTICYAKITRAGEVMVPVGVARGVARRLVSRRAPWGIAAPIAHRHQDEVTLVEPVEQGESLASMLQRAPASPATVDELARAMRSAAEGLEALSSLELRLPSTVTPRSMLAQLGAKADTLHHVAPELHLGIVGALRQLEHSAARLKPEALRVSHGAFRHEHLLHTPGQPLTAVDVDNLRLAGPSADAGSFLAFLDLEAILHPDRADVVRECEASFTGALGPSIDPSWVGWYRAEGHVKWALRRFFSLAPEWPRTTRSLITAATRTLAETGRDRSTVRSC